MWEDVSYCWAVVCKNNPYHSAETCRMPAKDFQRPQPSGLVVLNREHIERRNHDGEESGTWAVECQ